jgi:thiol-disulfide isomerase/thioredoxin
MEKIIIQLWLLLFCTSITYAQNSKLQNDTPLNIGDTISNDLVLGVLMDSTEIKLADLGKKIIIIDFWATYCQACINSLPDLQAIQDKYGEDIQVLLVTSESKTRVEGVLERSEVLKNADIRLPFLINNRSLKQVFPHVTIPHVVVIDSSGSIRAITHSSDISESNVKRLLLGEPVNFLVKDDFNGNVVQDTEQQGGIKDNLLWESRLLKQGNGSARITIDEIGNFITSVNFQFTPINLFYKAYSYFKLGSLLPINSKRVVVEVKDSLSYMQYANNELQPLPFFPRKFPYLHYANRHEYDSDNTFTYSLKMPDMVSDSQTFNAIMGDLNRYFPIKGKVETRKVPSWVIRATSSSYEKLSSRKRNAKEIFTSDSLGVINKPIERFFDLLKYFVEAEPFINETGIEYLVDLVIDFHDSPLRDPRNGLITNSPLDRKTLKHALEAKGLTMNLEKRDVEVLIIYD